ncbi:winged helix DNA-binding domain-containing protein [Actinomadura kijaniata]|uniref:winged helix DNA-binding domain-containing protein n=1 Tax=Actinomadura kijaniata TaxID=46161 RepID=UPI003F1B80B9
MILSRRALNRATLARQLLLERVRKPVVETVEHLVGLQAQTPHTWYHGLAARLDGIRAEDVAAPLVDRRLVRIALMRSTIHLVSADDCRWLRPLVQPVLDRDLFHNSLHGGPVQGLDMDELVAAARPILEERPRTAKELGALLAERWPDRAPASLAYAARNRMALVQVPPRGVWGSSGPIAHTTAEHWLGAPLDAGATLDRMVLRYLAAFGPASVMDVQAWSGLTRLREVVERLRPRLVTFRSEDGRELFDLPDAPRPGEDAPAPARLLYDFDNLLLSHADRSRFVTEEHLAVARRRRNVVPGTILLDGVTAGEWTLTDEALTLRPHTSFTGGDEEALAAEARHHLDFAGATGRDVRFGG